MVFFKEETIFAISLYSLCYRACFESEVREKNFKMNETEADLLFLFSIVTIFCMCGEKTEVLRS